MVEKMEMESTADFVKRMEAKLNNKSNTKKELNSKDMLQSINEYREVFMRDAFKNNIPLNDNVKNGSDVVSVSYLKVIFLTSSGYKSLLFYLKLYLLSFNKPKKTISFYFRKEYCLNMK